MEKPEHWEPWWDDEIVSLRFPVRAYVFPLLWGIGALILLLFIALVVFEGPIPISGWALLGFVSLFALTRFALVIRMNRSPRSLCFEGAILLLPQAGFWKLEPNTIDLRRYERADLFADHWPEPRLNKFKTWVGLTGAGRAPYTEKWAILLKPDEAPARFGAHQVVELADVRLPTKTALALLNYRIAIAASSPGPEPDFETIDQRTPPPGISIIGRLPHDTAWWDADELGLELNRRLLVPWIVLALFMCAILIPEIENPLTWASLLDQWDRVFYGALGVVVVFGATYLLLHKHALIVSRNTLKRRILPLLGLNVPKELRLADYHDASPTTRLIKGDELCDGVLINQREYDAYAPTLRIPGTLLSVDISLLPPLLTYRIAKAKGENPPPPEFS